MAYTVHNYQTKKALIEDFKKGKPIDVFSPGPFEPLMKNGNYAIEGSHYPQPHKWYAQVEVKDGIITSIK